MNCSVRTPTSAETIMARAAALALYGRGRTAPNPCVAALLVRNNEVLSEGWHEIYGGQHAEINCLDKAYKLGVDLTSCELYVTLEPCNHKGKTPPCTKAILDAGIKSVIIGCADPNPEVVGGGAKALREAGVEIRLGVIEEHCRDLIADFIIWKTTDRPYVILKMAATLDGRIAGRNGRPEQISSSDSKAFAHDLRAFCGAIIVGGNTFYSDDPRLTCRLPNMTNNHQQPLAVVVTRCLPKKYDFKLIQDRPEQLIFWTAEQELYTQTAKDLSQFGCKIWGLSQGPAGLDLNLGLNRLRSELSCWHVLCEGGGRLAHSLTSQSLVDEFVLILAPKILGDDQAKPIFSGRKTQNMADSWKFRLTDCEYDGQDVRLHYRPLRSD